MIVLYFVEAVNEVKTYSMVFYVVNKIMIHGFLVS